MKVIKLLEDRSTPIFSFEFFPPKTDEGLESLMETIGQLKGLEPSYVSVTYGAGGSNAGKSLDLISTIKERFGLESMAHLTCVNSRADDITKVLDAYRDAGVANILALRGDPPAGSREFKASEGGYRHASELVSHIKKNYDFCIGVAGYPEGHPESKSIDEDIRNLKLKVDAGGDFIVTQLFFNNDDFFRFEEMVRQAGIEVPIIPGIMPITNFGQIERFTSMCGASIPDTVRNDLSDIKDDADEVAEYGTEYALRQCKGLIERGVAGIHFYTLNKSMATVTILKALHLSDS
ncbi:MAG: methylenetetrahydrofolate reductase [NAD(P)H] [Nitrospinae bacterium]|nr:methylenetetrahydrofolate reductase [NAD(P)H] [Nitrospinota bacterium]